MLIKNVSKLIWSALNPAVLLLSVGVSVALLPDAVGGLVVGVSAVDGSLCGGPVVPRVGVSGSFTSLL